MKIDFYISSLSGGGAENVLVMLAKQFAEKGNQVSITSLEKREQFYDVPENVELHKIQSQTKSKLRESFHDFVGIKRHLRESKADVSISFLSRCNLILLLAALFTKDRIIVCDRNNPLREHSKKVFVMSCWLYKRADKIVVQTEQIRQMYPEYLQKKLIVIENPLDTEKMDNQVVVQDTIKKEKVIISVGRLEKQKDFKTLIRAFHNISEKYPEWILKIFGVGNMKQELQELIELYGETSRIQLCGHTKEPYVEMKKSEIFVLSSFYEGFPNVLCEAMYAGLPCIATDCVSGPRELIKNGENGFLVPIGNTQAMEQNLIQLMQNEELRKMVGNRANKECDRLKLTYIANKWLVMLKQVKENR